MTIKADSRLELLAQWIGTIKLPAGPFPITRLFEQLRRLCPRPRPFPFKTAASLGTWIGRHKAIIKAQLGVRVKPTRTANARYWTFMRVRCHGVGSGGHAMATAPGDDVMAAANSEALWLDAID